MVERFANAARSTITAGIDDNDLAVTVDDPTVFPGSGVFRCVIAVRSGSNLVDPELVKVTAVAGSVLTIERAAEVYAGEQVALAHPSGATIAQVITEAGLAAAIAEATPALDFGEVGDIAASAFGDAAAAGATGEIADAGHRHPREANPLTAHLAAGDPHAQYLTPAEGSAAYDAAGAAAAVAAAAVNDGDAAGGQLAGTYPNPTVAASHSGSTHAAAQAAAEATAAAALGAHTGDATDAHDASAVSVVPFGTIAATTVQAALEEIVAEAGGGFVTGEGAPTPGVDQVWELDSDFGTPTGGTFKLTFRAETTAAIPFDATVAEICDALAALSTVGVGNVIPATGEDWYAEGVSFATDGYVVIQFTADLGHQPVEAPGITDDTMDFPIRDPIDSEIVVGRVPTVGTGTDLAHYLDEERGLEYAYLTDAWVQVGLRAIVAGANQDGSYNGMSLTGVSTAFKLRLLGEPTGGDFTLIFRGEETAPIAFDANVLDVGAALEALSSIGAGNVTAYGTGLPETGPLPSAVRFVFIGTLGGGLLRGPDQQDPDFEYGQNNLTGGTTPTVDLMAWSGGRTKDPNPAIACQVAIDKDTGALLLNVGTIAAPVWSSLAGLKSFDDGSSGMYQGAVDVWSSGATISAFDRSGGVWAISGAQGHPGGTIPLVYGELYDVNENVVATYRLIRDAFILRGVGLNAPPADDSLEPADLAVYFDPTDGAASPKWKGKSADGTVVSGALGGGGLPSQWADGGNGDVTAATDDGTSTPVAITGPVDGVALDVLMPGGGADIGRGLLFRSAAAAVSAGLSAIEVDDDEATILHYVEADGNTLFKMSPSAAVDPGHPGVGFQVIDILNGGLKIKNGLAIVNIKDAGDGSAGLLVRTTTGDAFLVDAFGAIGFFDKADTFTPAAQQTVADIADPTLATPESNALKINELLAALRLYGLVA